MLVPGDAAHQTGPDHARYDFELHSRGYCGTSLEVVSAGKIYERISELNLV